MSPSIEIEHININSIKDYAKFFCFMYSLLKFINQNLVFISERFLNNKGTLSVIQVKIHFNYLKLLLKFKININLSDNYKSYKLTK